MRHLPQSLSQLPLDSLPLDLGLTDTAGLSVSPCPLAGVHPPSTGPGLSYHAACIRLHFVMLLLRSKSQHQLLNLQTTAPEHFAWPP